MNEEETAKILAYIKIAYPKFYYKISEADSRMAIKIWHDAFKDYDIKIVGQAVKNLTKKLEYPPTIADVSKEIQKMFTQEGNKSIDYWNEALAMIKNANYMTLQEFENHSEICKRFFGDITQLRPYGMMEMRDIYNNIQPRFLRYADSEVIEQKEQALLGNDVKEMIQKLAQEKTLKLNGGIKNE